MSDRDWILVKTRSGKKVHSGSPGSSVTRCGHWLKVNGSVMAFPKSPVVKALEKGAEISNPSALGPRNLVLCENCFPTVQSRTAQHVEEHYA